MTLLEEAQSIVADRAGQYGDTQKNMQVTAILWNAYQDCIELVRGSRNLRDIDIPQLMIQFKQSREILGHKRDNPVDIAGYADVLDRVWEGK